MTISLKSTSVITLEKFLEIPETEPASEYIDGKIYRKPMPQGKHSTLQIELASRINQIGKAKKLAYAFTELRCTFAGQSIVSDIAVFEWGNIPLDENGQIANKFETAPDWLIEIISPEQSASKVIRKITFSLKNGTKLGYFIDAEDESITVFQPNQLPEVKEGKDILPVLSILSDWELTVADVFSWLNFAK